jgi:hypothetical protein
VAGRSQGVLSFKPQNNIEVVRGSSWLSGGQHADQSNIMLRQLASAHHCCRNQRFQLRRTTLLRLGRRIGSLKFSKTKRRGLEAR